MWRVYVAHICGCMCALERCKLQFRFDYYLTLGYTYGVRVDREQRLSLIPNCSKIIPFGVIMYTVTTKDGSTFVFETFEEIAEFWGEVVWADGAVDAEVSIRFTNPMND